MSRVRGNLQALFLGKDEPERVTTYPTLLGLMRQQLRSISKSKKSTILW